MRTSFIASRRNSAEEPGDDSSPRFPVCALEWCATRGHSILQIVEYFSSLKEEIDLACKQEVRVLIMPVLGRLVAL